MTKFIIYIISLLVNCVITFALLGFLKYSYVASDARTHVVNLSLIDTITNNKILILIILTSIIVFFYFFIQLLTLAFSSKKK
jgi:hypothetical protein